LGPDENAISKGAFFHALVAHTCNPIYSGGRDEEDRGSKSTWVNSSQDPILKNPSQKEGLVEWLKVEALSSSPSTEKKEGHFGVVLGGSRSPVPCEKIFENVTCSP
jgi:hypothetical protein